MVKVCFKCGVEKELDLFYVHKQMADGHLNKCKECTKKDATNHRGNNIEAYRAYDRARGNRQTAEYGRKYNKDDPQRYKAHYLLTNAVRDGRLTKEPCMVCGTMDRLEAHHHDYDKPLDVWWMCSAHHSQFHRDLKELAILTAKDVLSDIAMAG